MLPHMRYLKSLNTVALLTVAGLTGLLAHDDEGNETPLEQEMSGMNQPYRTLSKAFRKAPDASNNAEFVVMAETMLKHAKASVDYVPERAQKLEAAAQEKMVADYKKAMKANILTLEQLIVALKAEDYVKAKELLTKLKQQKSDGHDRFKEDDED